MNEQAEMRTACREKYWEEDDAAGQIDRLRDEVARLCRVVTEQTKVLAKLAVHQHAQDGRLMTLLANDLEQRGPGLFAHDDGIPHRIRKPHERR